MSIILHDKYKRYKQKRKYKRKRERIFFFFGKIKLTFTKEIYFVIF